MQRYWQTADRALRLALFSVQRDGDLGGFDGRPDPVPGVECEGKDAYFTGGRRSDMRGAETNERPGTDRSERSMKLGTSNVVDLVAIAFQARIA